MLLEHPLARPLQSYIPRALQPVLTSQTVSAPPPPQHEYEPARVYLARWAHELQVARSREEVGVLLGQRAAEAAAAAAAAADVAVTAGGRRGSPPLATSMLSSSISLLSGSVVQAARALTASGRLRMLYEEEHVVWDETVQAETGIGTFEVLSTDTTPPPPKVERQTPLSSAEWRLFFDYHVPLPTAPPPSPSPPPSSSSSSGGPRRTPSPGTPPAQLSASMVEVIRDEESFEEVVAAAEEPVLPRGCEGRIVVPLSDIRRRIFAGTLTRIFIVWRFLFGLYDWDSTYAERKAIKAARTAEYWRMKYEWLATAERLGDVSTQDDVDPDDKPGLMYYDAVTRVDKDILRTDRQHPFYQRQPDETDAIVPDGGGDGGGSRRPAGVGPGPRRLNVLRDVLVTYAAVYAGSDGLGYVQGMSDLASPFVVVADADEADAFWCFANSMEEL
ncbi:hypothetical protein HK405_012341, partial [Cladochytrium tenue]